MFLLRLETGVFPENSVSSFEIGEDGDSILLYALILGFYKFYRNLVNSCGYWVGRRYCIPLRWSGKGMSLPSINIPLLRSEGRE